MRYVFCILILLAGCAANTPAPVVERQTTFKKTAGNVNKNADKDWRPDTYIVKKNDTLYSIGLEYGYDYKEIAQRNNIPPPYVIRLGQSLKIKEADTGISNATSAVPESNDANVVIKPLNSEAAYSQPMSAPVNAAATRPAAAALTPTLSEPKAIREPYSEKALATLPTPTKSAKPPPEKLATVSDKTDVAKSLTNKVETNKSEPVKSELVKPVVENTGALNGEDDVVWSWPTVGKVVAGFNESSNKGVDINGKLGQPVIASAAGKVIYSGSDLRGYGKLVIIKHNKTYLSVYAHNSQILVKEGQQVSKGQKISEMGNSDADQVKLHFEIRRQGKSVDPAKYLSNN